MSSKKNIICNWALLLICMGPLRAQEAVWVIGGWELFPASADARWTALGGAAVGIDTSTGLSGANPAQILQPDQITYFHQSRFAGIVQQDALAVPWTAFGTTIHLVREGVDRIPDTRRALLDWGEDGVPGTGDPGEGNGILDEGERLDRDQLRYFSQSRWGLYLPFTFDWNHWHAGVAVKGLFQTLGSHTGSGFGVDVGLRGTWGERWNWGLAVHNVTTGLQLWDSGRLEITAPTLGLGLARRWPIPRLASRILLTTNLFLTPGRRDFSSDFHFGKTGGNWSLGLEGVFRNRVALRLGRSSQQSLTGGLGLLGSAVELDYAFILAAPAADLGPTHQISLTCRLSWLKRELQSRL